jgi:hypothetical protein
MRPWESLSAAGGRAGADGAGVGAMGPEVAAIPSREGFMGCR